MEVNAFCQKFRMRTTVLIIVVCFLSISVRGQQDPIRLRNDVGPILELQLARGFINADFTGVQYRYQKTQNLAFRSSLGYFNLNEAGTRVTLWPTSVDTYRTRHIQRIVEGFFVSGSAEMQRRFYRNIFLYAGGEYRAGYGKAYTDTQITINYMGPNPIILGGPAYPFQTTANRQSREGTGWMMSATLLIGGRVYAGKRFIVGTEFSNPLYLINSRTGDEKQRNSGVDASTDHLMQRFYVSYRFR